MVLWCFNPFFFVIFYLMLFRSSVAQNRIYIYIYIYIYAELRFFSENFYLLDHEKLFYVSFLSLVSQGNFYLQDRDYRWCAFSSWVLFLARNLAIFLPTFCQPCQLSDGLLCWIYSGWAAPEEVECLFRVSPWLVTRHAIFRSGAKTR